MTFKALGPALSAALTLLLSLDSASARTLNVVAFGDSLTAGYQLPPDEAFPARLETLARSKGLDVAIANAGVSGDTTADGLARIDWSIPDGTDGVILELGANDALRGLALDATRLNLEWMTQQSKKIGAKVLLLGMRMPPNYGADYGRRFAEIYPQVARSEKVGLVPFLLTGVADHPEAMRLFQADRIHPTAEAQPRMLDNVWPELKKIL
jgi:acyl-CoA thioesterase-1